MRYVSIDIETTGLDPTRCHVLEFAAVLEGTRDVPVEELPYFHVKVYHETLHLEPVAARMNAALIEEWTRLDARHVPTEYVPGGWLRAEHVGPCFRAWADANGLPSTITVAGKNVASFDLLFLHVLPNWNVRTSQRVLDPSAFYLHVGDERLPSTDTCLERAGLTPEAAHTALGDSRDVIRLLRPYLPK